MSKVKSKFIGILLFCTLLGLVVVTPATSAAPSWISEGKFAKYLGGFNIEMGTAGQPGYIRATMTVGFNWTIKTATPDEARIEGGWNISIYVNFNNTPLITGSFGTTGYEIVRRVDSIITTGGGYDLFGMEHVGTQTALWVEDTSILPASNISIGGRGCVTVQSAATLPIPGLTSIPVTRYYDRETGALMGMNIAINITALGSFPAPPHGSAPSIIGSLDGKGDAGVNQIPGLDGLGGFETISFPIVVVSTNLFPFAWNMGGDITLWLTAIGILLGVSALFCAIIYARKR